MDTAPSDQHRPDPHRASHHGPTRQPAQPHWRARQRHADTRPTSAEKATTSNQVTVFVFQGGGSLTATQVGMVRSLIDAGIYPDLVVGCSAGALNAACFATDPTPTGLDHLERLWTSLRRQDVFPLAPQDLLRALLGHGEGLTSQNPLRHVLHRALDDAHLDHLALPAHIVATDLASGDPITISTGPVVSALLASTALPGIFPPVQINGYDLIDGGIAAHTPVQQADALGATVSYLLPSLGPTDPTALPHGAAAHALRALTQLLGRVSTTEITAAHHTVHMLPAPELGHANPFDFGHTRQLITEGQHRTHHWLQNRRHRPHGQSPATASDD